MNNVKDVIDEVVGLISNKFPCLDIFIKYKKESNEYFVLINDKNIFGSAEFSLLLTDIDLNIFLKREIYNIYISYLLGNEESSIQSCKTNKYVFNRGILSFDKVLVGPMVNHFSFEYKSNKFKKREYKIEIKNPDLFGHDGFSESIVLGDNRIWKTDQIHLAAA